MADRIFQPYPGEILPGGEGVQPQISTATTTSVSGASVGSASPLAVANAPSVGTSVNASHEDHVHLGVTSINGLSGAVTVSIPTGYTSTPADVGTAGNAGSAAQWAKGDHVHKGVHSVSKSGAAQLFGDVTLTGGANITLTQTGQDISIAAASGSAPAWTFLINPVSLAADTTKIYAVSMGSNCTLPDPTIHTATPIFFHNSAGAARTINRNGAELINGLAANLSIASGQDVVLISDGSDWWQV